MNRFHKAPILAAAAILLFAVLTSTGARAADWKSLMTIAEVKRDTSGKLLPLQSYDETTRRGMSFILDDHLKWFRGPPETIVEENGKTQIPWVYHSNLQHLSGEEARRLPRQDRPDAGQGGHHRTGSTSSRVTEEESTLQRRIR